MKIRPVPTNPLVITLALLSLPLFGGRAAAAATIGADLPVVRVLATDPIALAGAGAGAFTFIRDSGTETDLDVSFTISGTARNGVDYVSLSGLVRIPAGKFAADVVVEPIGSLSGSQHKTVIVTLAPATPNPTYRLITDRTATVTIIPNNFNDPPPTVRLTAPADGGVFEVPAKVVLSAEAAGSNNTVLKVSFFSGDQLLASITQAPFTFVWTNPPPGKYTLVAAGIDAMGRVGFSRDVRIIVSNAPPVVTLTAPTEGSLFRIPTNITLVATATDVDDPVDHVAFFADGKRLGGVANPPYTLVWSNVPPGRHTVTAGAVDKLGATGYSAPVHITVSNAPPVVTVTAPTEGSLFRVPTNITLVATATDADDPVDHVAFFVDGMRLGGVANPPYTLVWSNVPPGRHTVTAGAVDKLGATGYSAPVHITVSNVPPVVTVTAPTEGSLFRIPTNITLLATATDVDDPVHHVAFFVDGTRLGGVTNPPYTLVWSNVPPGRHIVTAGAVDKLGATGYSAPVHITVSNAPPVVSLISPTNNQAFLAHTNITLVAQATDSDDAVRSVSFYAGTNLLGVSTNSPYSITWSNVAPGRYTLMAYATDSYHAQVSSPEVNIVVDSTLPRVVGAPEVAVNVPAEPVTTPKSVLLPQLGFASGLAVPRIDSVERLADGACRLNLTGFPGAKVLVEGSADLSSWAPLGTLELKDGHAVFLDAPVAKRPTSFYRVSLRE